MAEAQARNVDEMKRGWGSIRDSGRNVDVARGSHLESTFHTILTAHTCIMNLSSDGVAAGISDLVYQHGWSLIV